MKWCLFLKETMENFHRILNSIIRFQFPGQYRQSMEEQKMRQRRKFTNKSGVIKSHWNSTCHRDGL